MIITICGSMAFAKEMKLAKEQLEKAGHKVFVPEFVEEFIKVKKLEMLAKIGDVSEGVRWKKAYDLIKKTL